MKACSAHGTYVEYGASGDYKSLNKLSYPGKRSGEPEESPITFQSYKKIVSGYAIHFGAPRGRAHCPRGAIVDGILINY